MFEVHSFEAYRELISQAILWAGYGFLGLLFLVLPLNLLETETNWGNLFANRQGESHHIARYVLFFGTLILAVRFLVAVVNAEAFFIGDDVREAMQIFNRFDVDKVAGGYGAAYLLAKVTDGQVLNLFGRRRL